MSCIVLGVILGFIQIWKTGWDGVTPAVIWGFWNFYIFVCIFSLYKRLEQEKREMIKFSHRDSSISRA
jgi:hypothetical protein